MEKKKSSPRKTVPLPGTRKTHKSSPKPNPKPNCNWNWTVSLYQFLSLFLIQKIDLSLPLLRYKKTEASILGTLCLPETSWHLWGYSGSLWRGPCGRELKSPDISHWETETFQETHGWAWERLLPQPNLHMRLMRDPWARISQLSCSQTPDLEKLWENNFGFLF